MRSLSVAAVLSRLDRLFFVVAGIAAVWFAWLLFTDTFDYGWWGVVSGILFWAMLAYLTLPRLHHILTYLYVPDYFIGRTRTGDGRLGDPVNVTVLGEREQLVRAMTNAGWSPADPVTPRSSWRIVTSVLRRRSYPTAPVSPLYLFGRRQDLTFQREVAGNPARRHHVRFWRTPEGWLLPGGAQVDWLGAATYDRSVGLSLFTLQVTHRIAADIDTERDHLVDALCADPAVGVEVLHNFTSGYHARNGGGDSVHTDGDLPVVDVRALPVPPAGDAAPTPDAVPRRPVHIVLGVLFVLLRAAGGMLWLAELVDTWEDRHHVLVPGGHATLVAVVCLHILWTLALLILALALWRGRDVARVGVLCWTTVTITAVAVGWALHGNHVTVHTGVFTLALDILVLLALSARDARWWTLLSGEREQHSRHGQRGSGRRGRHGRHGSGQPAAPRPTVH